MKIAIVKSNFGSRNSVFWNNLPKIENIDYYYFTDSNDEISKNNLKTRGINVINVNQDNCFIDSPVGSTRFRSRRQGKIYKILPDIFIPNYDYYIWMDAYFELKNDPRLIILNTGFDTSVSNFCLFKHSQRNCVYEEAELIKQINYDDTSVVDFQMMAYKSAFNYPANNGLYECTCFIFKNNDKSKYIRLEWFNHINRFSSRDQLSLPFVLNQFKEKPIILEGKILPGNAQDNPYFISAGNY